MTVADQAARSTTSAACRIRWDVLERRCRELGVGDNDTARGELLGVNRNTVLRWRHGTTGVSLATAIRVAHILGVQVDQLIEP